MEPKLYNIKSDKERYIEDSAEVLKNAAECNFTHVIVLGYDGDDIAVFHSSFMDRSKVIGSIEMAKHIMLHGGLE